MACWELREMLGRRAGDIQELLETLEEIPLDSIYFHTHSFFLRHSTIAGPYPNDFANWTAIQVRDRVLGERLAVVDPFEAGDLEALRIELITIVDDHLSGIGFIPRVVFGDPFFFMQSRIQAVPTGAKARSLAEFVEVLERVDASSIYFHVFDARARKSRGRSDFQIWIEDALGLPDLGKAVSTVNPYATSLEGVRERLVALCRRELASR